MLMGILRCHRSIPSVPASTGSYDYSKEASLLEDIKGESVTYVSSLFKNVPSADCRLVDQ